MRLEIRGKAYEVEVTDSGSGVHEVTVDGTLYEVRLPVEARSKATAMKREAAPRTAAAPSRPRGAAGAGSVVAPLPGLVTKFEVSEGEPVTQGQTLVVLESMKMNVPVECPRDGAVVTIHVKVGDNLQVGEPIMEIG